MQLLAEYHDASTSLTLFMASCFVQAAAELPNHPSGELYERFIGWVGLQRRAVGRVVPEKL
jgi:hypothetical protein